MRILSVNNKHELRILHTKSSPVEKVDGTTRDIVNDMLKIVERGDTIGLSAVQLGYSIRVFVINMSSEVFDLSKDLKVISGCHTVEGKSLVCINPKIVSSSGDNVQMFEGCLSTQSYGLIAINRPGSVDLKYSDLSGNECTIRTYNWLARCIQHEMDHLEGVLLANVVDNIRNYSVNSVSEEDCSSVCILVVGKHSY